MYNIKSSTTNNKIIFLIFFIIFLTNSNIEAILINNLEDNDYLCFSNLVTKLNLVKAYPFVGGVYNFCNQQSTCVSGVITRLSIYAKLESVTPGASLNETDISCFTSMTSITISNLPIDPRLIYYKHPTTTYASFYDITGISAVTEPIAAYKTFNLQSASLNNSVIKMSYLQNIETFSYFTEVCYVDVDVVLTSLVSFLIGGSMNLPDLSQYPSFYALRIQLNPSFDTSTWSNFDNYKSYELCQISFPETYVHTTTTPLFFLNNMNIKNLALTYCNFAKPASVIDLTTTNTNYSLINLHFKQNVPHEFHINGAVPFKMDPKKTGISTTYGDFSVIPALDQFKQISITYSKLSGDLPKKYGSATLIDFSSNQLTGTIDDSYCNTQLRISYNKLTGLLPTCLSCYYRSYNIYASDLAGNNFTAPMSTPDCPSLAPTVKVIDKNTLSISGKDIGFLVSGFKINGNLLCNTTLSTVVLYGGEYTCYIGNANFTTDPWVTVQWTALNTRIFTFPITNSAPIPTSATIATDKITFSGTFFSSYLNYTIQSIEIDGSDCKVNSTSFTVLNCIPSNIPYPNQLSLVKISNSNQIKSVYIDQTLGAKNNMTCLSGCNGESNGICDLSTGTCHCKENRWTGDDCSIAYHYVSSATAGGEIVFNGEFGTVHNNLTITIGGIDCPVTFNSSNIIKCTAPQGEGVKSANITQNGISVVIDYQYANTNENIPCPNDCYSSLSHGACNNVNGQCKCNSGYGSHDCSTLSNNNNGGDYPSNEITIDEANGTISIINGETSFDIYIGSLFEVDFSGKVIQEYNLKKNWKLDSLQSDKVNTYNFKQSIQGSNCQIICKIEEIKDVNGKSYSFAGVDFLVSSGSVKFSISISNYSYENNLNSLKLELVSSSNQDSENGSDCNSSDSELDTDNYNDKSNLNYIKISKNSRVLSGRFINRVESDGVSTYLSTTVSKQIDSSSILITLNLPHFKNQATVDPDFSVLLSSEFKSSCDSNDENKRKTYVIPVAVVVSVFGVAAIIASVILIRKKRREHQLNVKLSSRLSAQL